MGDRGENTPSLNDRSHELGGSSREALFRTRAGLAGGTRPNFGRELPQRSSPNYLNRRALGGKFKYLFGSRDAAVSTRVELGARRVRTPVERADGKDETDGIVQFDATVMARATLDIATTALDAAGPVDAVGISDQRASVIVCSSATTTSRGDFDGVWGPSVPTAKISPGVFRPRARRSWSA